MWGDTDHIKRLKREQQPWPSDFPDPKKAKQQAKADRAAQKAAEAEARKLAKWSQLQPSPAKPAKQPPVTTRPSTTDLADLKAAEWQAKQEARDVKAHQQALKATIRAEKDARQAQARAAAAEIQWLKEEQAHWKEGWGGRSAAPNYTPAYVPSAIGCGLSGCAGPVLALLLLLLLFLCICDCG